MRGSVLSDRDAAVGRADLDVELRVGDRETDLLPASAGGEDAERGGEHHLAGGCQTGGDADHVLLRDPYLDEPLGTDLLELGGLGGACQVRIHDDDPRVGRQLCERLAVVVALGYVGHSDSSVSSLMATSSSSLLAALPWKDALFSMKETPLPLIVFMIIATGRPEDSLAFSMASMIIGMS